METRIKHGMVARKAPYTPEPAPQSAAAIKTAAKKLALAQKRAEGAASKKLRKKEEDKQLQKVVVSLHQFSLQPLGIKP
jgi:hypothetical protein